MAIDTYRRKDIESPVPVLTPFFLVYSFILIYFLLPRTIHRVKDPPGDLLGTSAVSAIRHVQGPRSSRTPSCLYTSNRGGQKTRYYPPFNAR